MVRLALIAALLCAASVPADAEPLRLRGDALAQAESPVGLLAFTAEGDINPTLDAEAVIWTSSNDEESTGDALVIVLRYRDPKNRGQARLGRFVVAAGALRPIHIDGAWGRARLPYELQAEAFAGIPVEPEMNIEAYDWVAGARVGRALGDWGSAGIGYVQRRDASDLADEEVGADAAYAPTRWLDLAARGSVDLIDLGFSEVRGSAALRRGSARLELFGTHRSPSRILPATSLFSVLGDVASQRYGASVRWRAAPRLDLDATTAVRRVDDDFGESLSARALLRLDDRGRGALTAGVRRERAPDASWTGLRGTARIPLAHQMTAIAEIELAVPDDSAGRGNVWPWALAAMRWRPRAGWTVAAALEGSATPTYRRRFDALVRLTRDWQVMR